MGPMIDFEDIFHGRHERSVGLRRDDPLLVQVRLEEVFFRVRPIVLSLALSTICLSTTSSSNRRKVQRACPAGGSEQVKAISLASAVPSKIRRLAEFGECLRVRTASNPSSTSCRRTRLTVIALVSSACAIWRSFHPSQASEVSAFNKIRAFINRCAGCLPLWTMTSSRFRSSLLNFTTYRLMTVPSPATNHLHNCPGGRMDSELSIKINDAGH